MKIPLDHVIEADTDRRGHLGGLLRCLGKANPLHAIELYLDALLFTEGFGHDTTLQHNLGERAQIAVAAGVILRKRTLANLLTLSTSTEYLVVRYVPERTSTLSARRFASPRVGYKPGEPPAASVGDNVMSQWSDASP